MQEKTLYPQLIKGREGFHGSLVIFRCEFTVRTLGASTLAASGLTIHDSDASPPSMKARELCCSMEGVTQGECGRQTSEGPTPSPNQTYYPSSMFQQTYFNLLAQLSEMPLFLERALLGLPREILLRQPECDRSPLIEHLWHVRDCEVDLYAARIDKVLLGEGPILDPVNVGSWVQDRGYLDREGDLALHEFTKLRAALLVTLRKLDERLLSRVGHRFDGTQIDVLGLVEQVAEHDRDHRWRIAAILRSYLPSQ